MTPTSTRVVVHHVTGRLSGIRRIIGHHTLPADATWPPTNVGDVGDGVAIPVELVGVRDRYVLYRESTAPVVNPNPEPENNLMSPSPNPRWLDLIRFFAPIIIEASVPHGAVFGPLVATAINAAEVLPGASGPDKKALVLKLVGEGMAALNVVKPTPIDSATLTTAVSKAIDTTVAVVNLVHKASGDVIIWGS